MRREQGAKQFSGVHAIWATGREDLTPQFPQFLVKNITHFVHSVKWVIFHYGFILVRRAISYSPDYGV
jgi:hypothetical protein